MTNTFHNYKNFILPVLYSDIHKKIFNSKIRSYIEWLFNGAKYNFTRTI